VKQTRDTNGVNFNKQVVDVFKMEAQGVVRRWLAGDMEALMMLLGGEGQKATDHVILCLPTISDEYLRSISHAAAVKAKELLASLWRRCCTERSPGPYSLFRFQSLCPYPCPRPSHPYFRSYL